MESPGFREANFRSLSQPKLKISKTVFDREKALREAPEEVKLYLVDLFKQIDTIELTLNYYDLLHGGRTMPPREALLSRFSEEEQIHLQSKAAQLSQYKYLKLKHLLVDLRSDQYTYYDTFSHSVGVGKGFSEDQGEDEYAALRIGEDIAAYPLGLKDKTQLSQLLFQKQLYPALFNERELQLISSSIWKEKQENILDFTNPEHLLQIYKMRADLLEEQERDPDLFYCAAGAVIDTLIYYEQQAQLSSLQKDILEAKLHKTSNICIAERINAAYGKTYNDNYISTIFHQKILPQIAQAAINHYEIVKNLFFPENFKKCKDCGEILLINADNFVRQKKSTDGFAPRCKKCEKIKRDKRV